MQFSVALRTSSVVLALTALSCKSAPPEPTPTSPTPETTAAATATASSPETTATATATASASASAEAMGSAATSAAPSASAPPGMKPVATVPVSEGDPAKGVFTMADATAGLAGKGKLTATMVTDKGTLKCELWPDKAPITVANFVGLARGVRPWKTPAGEWVKKPLYDGTPFHRIIKGFMIQGGDPKGNGSGDPGYVIPDEVWDGAHHDEIGLICMANRGPNTNGSQFFIMDGKASHLDGGYTIFGKCTPDSVVEAIAGSETAGDRAVNAPKIKKLTITRG
ncbi:MAG TPA: peptidylprolyl isomerase [Polyangiaceae bacterium]|jgi:peptidyl-prolyl cis-trans isomerase A (cyclophilin A)|nr:peptidylprolyl isomerase [Polyangiaceae bacterium]